MCWWYHSDFFLNHQVFALQNFTEVSQLEEFPTLIPSKLSDLISDDELCVENEEVLSSNRVIKPLKIQSTMKALL